MPRKKKALKVSPEQWERFNKHTTYWQVMLGLQDWTVTGKLADKALCDAAQSELQDDAGSITIAWVCDSFEHHVATVYLREFWEDGVIPQYELDKAAFHEMCHLLLRPIEEMAEKSVAHDLVMQEIHRTIRVLENTFFENQRDSIEV
jgi:hypothetical protein